MKLITFKDKGGTIKSGWIEKEQVFDMEKASGGKLPGSILGFLEQFEENYKLASHIAGLDHLGTYNLEEIELLAPLPNPGSVRDFMAFEGHVATIAAKNKQSVVPEWYEIPVFYFTNHHAITGPNQKIQRPAQCSELDYELEIACIIGREGRNISAEKAEDYIAGYTILNDWSARDLQMKEMKAGLGPAKGKDFATSIGPYIVTKDELEKYRDGDRLNLEMTARVNGKQLSKGNFKDIHHSFGQMIERASSEAALYPGDIIGSGTVSTGCILELGTDIQNWLQPGDVVELEITGLGTLTNEIM
ncbi:fumarylacetoacetate hydrolase family protein [Cytobacillus sp. BC1816]|uniref:fumarylacetoacetate hydrolase family protein n=1 Tax=Cytobacillus sp. BC1816 TaxID=3440154 RepID=UPI003F515A22